MKEFSLDILIKTLHSANFFFFCRNLILVQNWYSSVKADYSNDFHFGMCKNHLDFFWKSTSRFHFSPGWGPVPESHF